MRNPIRLLLLPLLIGIPTRALHGAQTVPAPGSTQRTADSTTVSVRWNRLVPRFVDEAAASRQAARAAATAARDSAALRRLAQAQSPLLMQVYALLSVAQYAAGNAARAVPRTSAHIAVASASATVLTNLFTDSTVRASIAQELARDVERTGTTSRAAAEQSAGRELGDVVARRVIARAPMLDLVAPSNRAIPTGPGMWFSAPGIPPLGIAATTARGWLIDSASQFRPAPPPAYGSPPWQASIAEVRRVARERTAEHTAIAQKWNAADPFAEWNATASAAIRRHQMSDAEATRVFAVMNVGVSDAIVACFEAKYFYWTIRPSQADTTFTLAEKVRLPNFPSFPSGHACSAGAFDAALGHFFPGDRAEFTRVAEEQAMSRLYGGIHYRFDNDEGLALGRAVARYGVDRERRGGLGAWISAAMASRP